MIHLTIQQLSSYHDHELAEASAESARLHLAMCEACAGKLERLTAQCDALASALGSKAGDELHERITSAIEERIRGEQPKGVEPRGAAEGEAPARATPSAGAPAPPRATPSAGAPAPPRATAPAEAPAPTRALPTIASVPPARPRVEVPRADALAAPMVPPVAATPKRAPVPDQVPPGAPAARAAAHSAPVTRPAATPAVTPSATDEPAEPDEPPTPARRPSGASHRRPISTSVWAAAAVLLIVAGVGVSIPSVRQRLVDTRLPEPGMPSTGPAAGVDTASGDSAATDVAQSPASDDSYPGPMPGQSAAAPGQPAGAQGSATAAPAHPSAQAPHAAPSAPSVPAARPGRPAPTPAPQAPAGESASADDSRDNDSSDDGGSSGNPDFEPVPIRADDALAGVPSSRAAQPGDPYAHLDARARDAVRRAQQLGQRAVSDLSVDGFDAAATEWERTLPLLSGNAYLAASLSLAEARYHAWQLSAGPEHASAAISAVRSYLALAPAGADRDRALSWLTRMGDAGYH